MALWNSITEAMAEHDPHLRAALERQQAAQEPAPCDRIHRVEVCLQDIIGYECELEDSMTKKIRALERTVRTQQQQIRNLQAWVEDDARGEC